MTSFDRMRGKRRIDHQHQRRGAGQRHAGKIFRRIERHFAIKVRRHRKGGLAAHHQRVAVGRRFRFVFGRDHAAGAGAVLDHDRLAENFRHFLRHDPRGDVGAAAGAEADQHLDRPVGIGRVLGVGRDLADTERERETKCDAQRSRCLHDVSLPVPDPRTHFLSCGCISRDRGAVPAPKPRFDNSSGAARRRGSRRGDTAHARARCFHRLRETRPGCRARRGAADADRAAVGQIPVRADAGAIAIERISASPAAMRDRMKPIMVVPLMARWATTVFSINSR